MGSCATRGRPAHRAHLQALKEDELRRVLTEPKNAIVKQKRAEQAMHAVELHITEDALGAIAATAVKKGVGARGLGGILEKLLMPVKFEVRMPSQACWQSAYSCSLPHRPAASQPSSQNSRR